MRAIWMEPGKLPEVREVGDLRCEWEEQMGGTIDATAVREDVALVHLRWGRQLGHSKNVSMDVGTIDLDGERHQQEIAFHGPVMFAGLGPDGPTDIDDDAGLLIMSGMAFGKAVVEA